MFGSALKLDGVKAFLNLLDEYTVMPSYGAEFGAKVYKIAEDNQGNRLTFMKITGGSLKGCCRNRLCGNGNNIHFIG